MTLELSPLQMVPLDGLDLRQQVQSALFNIEHFDHARFAVWCAGRSAGVPELARKRPPDRLYRVISDNEQEGEGTPVLVGVVIGYAQTQRGTPALCMVQILGVAAGRAGSYADPIGVPADALIDVTDAVKEGRFTV